MVRKLLAARELPSAHLLQDRLIPQHLHQRSVKATADVVNSHLIFLLLALNVVVESPVVDENGERRPEWRSHAQLSKVWPFVGRPGKVGRLEGGLCGVDFGAKCRGFRVLEQGRYLALERVYLKTKVMTHKLYTGTGKNA